MDVRSQIAMVFHLDKCIGCHTCSIACKNIWTDRKGAEYMWWNNVETKPGTGYPTRWEDQEVYKGGWERKGEADVELKGGSKRIAVKNIFHNPNLPVIDDYYEPFTYKYLDLIESPDSDDQPTARPVSLITGEPMDINMGPNWDDDLSGTPDFARQDPNLQALSPEEQEAMFQLERMAFFYLPRICNHCLNPACVAACPSGAIYKRGEDGIVLINQDVCRGWRMCVSACPYKKTYYNWQSGKSEKCILCYPRIEAGHAPACMHSCVGRIRYLGGILYDADKLHEVASAPEDELVERQLDLLLDPNDPEVIAAAIANGVPDSTIEAAQKSPVYRFVKEWGMALPLHAEFRTLPMLFYVPPLLPVMATLAKQKNERKEALGDVVKRWDDDWLYDTSTADLFGTIDAARFPLEYMASLFSAGDTEKVSIPIKKLMAVRIYRRFKTVGDISEERADEALAEVGLDQAMAEEIYYLTSLPKFDDRFVIPPAHREQAIEMLENTGDKKGNTGFGFKEATAVRGAMMSYQHYETLAHVFEYPSEDLEQNVMAARHALADYPAVVSALERFQSLMPSDRLEVMQELYLRSFDIQAVTTLDVGYVLFGDDYKRGELLSNLNREHVLAKVDCGNELADHLTNVVRLLARIDDEETRQELVHLVLAPALSKMISEFSPQRIEEKSRSYRKHYKTLIDTPTNDHEDTTLYRHALEALLALLRADFDVAEQIPVVVVNDFLEAVTSENEIEEKARSFY